jgi:SAM-dependent methyltransferase
MNHPINQPTTLSPKVDYGLDAPKELRRNALYGIAGVIMGPFILYVAQGALLGIIIGLVSLGSGLLLFGICAMMYRGSRVGKLYLRDEVLAALPWRGDERVLDIGCGHGLMMIGAAKHLTTGKAIGVDIWVQELQANNSADAARHNADLEGLAQKVEVRNGDARDLPFDNESIDVVLCSWVIHYLIDPEDRLQVLKEIERVLKPDGRVVIIDIDRVDEYRSFFVEKEWLDVTKSKPHRLFVTPTYVLTAVKPANS